MKPKHVALGAFFGLAVVAGGILVMTRVVGVHERVFEGKSAAQWRAELSSGDALTSQCAKVILETAIIPELLDAELRDTNDSRFKLAVAESLNNLRGVRVYCLNANGRRADALVELGKFGPSAKTAIPVLIQIMNGHDPATRATAAAALGQIRSDPELVIPALIQCLADSDIDDVAAEALGEFGPLAKAAVPKMLPLLHGDKEARHAASVALPEIDPEAAAKAGIKRRLTQSPATDQPSRNESGQIRARAETPQ